MDYTTQSSLCTGKGEAGVASLERKCRHGVGNLLEIVAGLWAKDKRKIQRISPASIFVKHLLPRSFMNVVRVEVLPIIRTSDLFEETFQLGLEAFKLLPVLLPFGEGDQPLEAADLLNVVITLRHCHGGLPSIDIHQVSSGPGRATP